MSVTINASTSSGLVQTADTSGTVEIQSNGSTKLTVASGGVTANTLTTTGNTSISNLTATGTFGGGIITAGTVNGGAANPLASGTTVDFTSIPSWVKRITVMLSGVSTSGTSPVIIQLGTSGGIDAASYLSTSQNAAAGSAAVTTGFSIAATSAAANLLTGNVFLCNITGNTWIESGDVAQSAGVSANVNSSGGTKTLSGTLTQIRITTVNGTDTFDAGTINILYEG